MIHLRAMAVRVRAPRDKMRTHVPEIRLEFDPERWEPKQCLAATYRLAAKIVLASPDGEAWGVYGMRLHTDRERRLYGFVKLELCEGSREEAARAVKTLQGVADGIRKREHVV